MSVYVYIYIYIYIYTHKYICKSVYIMNVCIHTSPCVNMCMCVHIYTYTRCLHKCIRTCIRTVFALRGSYMITTRGFVRGSMHTD